MSSESSGDDQRRAVICQPFTSFNDFPRMIPGTRVFRADCNHLVFLSPQGADFLLMHPDTIVACLPCEPTPDERFVVPGVREAAAAAFGTNEDTENFDEMLRRRDLKEWTE